MPKKLEAKLRREAIAKGLSKKKGSKNVLTARGKAYVYGTLRKEGWKPGGKRSTKSKPRYRKL